MARTAKQTTKTVTNRDLLQKSIERTDVIQDRIIKCQIASKDANAFASVVMDQIRLYDRLEKCPDQDKSSITKAMRKISKVASKYVD
jgi:hypothetical protein